jgi:hypothetical protein
VLTPNWLPEGYELVRVRRRKGRWVDAHWVRSNATGGDVVKLVEQDVSAPMETLAGATEVNLGTSRRPVRARLLTRKAPYRYTYLSWVQGTTRCTLFVSGTSSDEATRIARSLTEATAPPPVVAQAAPEGITGPSEDASLVPDESMTPEAAVVDAGVAVEPVEQAPMLPETADEDRAATPPATP